MPQLDTIDNDLDSRILNRDQEFDVAKIIADQKKQASKSKQNKIERLPDASSFDNQLARPTRESEEKEMGTEMDSGTERETAIGRKINQAREKVKSNQIESKVAGLATAPARFGTGYLLKAAWMNLIPSFGLSLIYINLHVFLRWIFPNMFCKLGKEWKSKITLGDNNSKNIDETGVGIIEVVVLLIIDLLLGIILLFLFAFFFMIIDFMEAGVIDKIKYIIGGLSNLSWDGMKTLFDAFSNF